MRLFSKLFVVLDTKGCGRVLGVFDDRKRAERVTQPYPEYYHLHAARLIGGVVASAPRRDVGRLRGWVRRVSGGPYRSPAVEPSSSPDDARVRGSSPSRVHRVHVVLGTMGQLHVVGVTASRFVAAALASRSPAYYRIQDCELDHINPEVLDWATDDRQRAFLEGLIRET